MTAHSITALALILHRLGILFEIKYLFNESLIERARNEIVRNPWPSCAHNGAPCTLPSAEPQVRMFLDNPLNMTHLIFIDSDIEFDARDVLRMLSHKKQLICGAYPKKAIPW